MIWGIVPAAGKAHRMQPLGFSKELLPVGTRTVAGREQPLAVSEYLLERMARAGVSRILFVINASKTDILEYFGAGFAEIPLGYLLQPHAAGLCDAIFRALPFIPKHADVLMGLPDTIWLPTNGFQLLPAGQFSLLTFPVSEPEWFDAVIADPRGQVRAIEVKATAPGSQHVWGAMRLHREHLEALHALWVTRQRRDELIGTVIDAYVRRGGKVQAVASNGTYVDVGTPVGFRRAAGLCGRPRKAPTASVGKRPKRGVYRPDQSQ